MTATTLHDLAVNTGAAPRPARKAPFSPRAALMVGAAIVVAGAGAAYLGAPKGDVATDAAYIQADSSTVAPKVKGLIAEVLVRDNQPVKRGDPLVRIDPEEFDAHVAAAAADLQKAEAAVLASQAALTSLGAEGALAASNTRSAQTSIRAADAQSDQARADQARYEALAEKGFVSRRDADQFKAAAITAASAADRTRAELEVSRNQASVTEAKRASLTAAVAQAQAAAASAQAALDLAKQDQAHTLITSPIDGVVGDRQAQAGDYVQPGSRLLTIVPLGSLYVTADFKETQVSRMVAGQQATIRVDALPGRKLKGVVESFAPGSGSQFSLLPFEPGTGNFTKIVQRVPVRIRIDPGQAGLERLRPGLSTTVTVRLANVQPAR
jgi:membrane fusion protein (multidrug efflux system)